MLKITIILVEPENEGNLGAIVRLMKNFNINQLIVINPKINVNSNIVYARAMHGRDLLKNLIKLPNLSELPKYDYLIGTTARPSGDYNVLRICISPEQLRENLKDFDGNIGILFGREGTGLTNKEMEICDCCVHIPASENYPTLNLSHACCILLYELFKLIEIPRNIQNRQANLIEKQTLFSFFDLILEYLNKNWAHFNEKRKINAKRIFQNLIGRSFVSGREAYTMNSVFRYIHLSIKRKKS
ncbi:MAG: TrmJ/YjtD family RNA methyltransferase [Candidatus Helarchaeota archaeon]|nr:TrmJ/YjtD family RNA methyltransferase [Candidatus Helarchaeota archaeon]